MSNFILPLNSLEALLPLAGGKGANLSALVRAGLPVPPGFIITTAAYGAFITVNGLEGCIATLSHSAHEDDSASLEVSSQAIQKLFRHAAPPQGLVEAIIGAYQQMTPVESTTEYTARAELTQRASNLGGQAFGSPPVAVRSSATSEDLPEASYAGQQETFLNVRGEQALLKAVKECWSSLWSARAMAYRLRQGVEPSSTSLAVLVQRMVESDIAGTLFTRNPLNGDRQILINAAWGLGKAVVDGRVTPDTYVLHQDTGLLERVEIGDKSVMTIVAAEGTKEVPVHALQRHKPALTNEQAVALARLATAVEAHFGVPQDIEWAIAKERIYILQSRPITALKVNLPQPSAPEHSVPGDDRWPALDERPAQPFDIWTQAVVGEVWPGPVSPMMWSAVPAFLGSSIRYALRGLDTSYLDQVQWAKRFYGRVYYNEGALVHIVSHELGLPSSFVDAALGSRRNVHPRHDQRFQAARLLRRLPFLVKRLLTQRGTGRELEMLFPQIDHWITDFNIRRLDHLGDRELWAELMLWVERFQRVINLQSEINGIAFASFSVIDRLMIRWFARHGLAQDLITGLTSVYTAEIGPALWQIAQLLRNLDLTNVILNNNPATALMELQNIPRAEPLVRELDSFLLRHGHRCASEGDWLRPRWADAPEQVVELLGSYLRAGEQINPMQSAARQRQRREQGVMWVEARLDPVRRGIFRFVLVRAQHAARLRDNGKHYYMKLALPIRRISVLFGLRWVDRGWLETADDIFFLTIPDIIQVIEAGNPPAVHLDLTKLVAERRKAFQYWAQVKAPEVISADGQPLPEKSQDLAGRVLVGTPASAGLVRGKARIIFDPREASRLQPGDILVTRATDPGWTPVFPLVAGLVLEVGGQLSHAAIVAREYGLPAVVNVYQATSRIRNGQIIMVNGTTGQVGLDGV